MNKTTQNLLILILSSAIILVCVTVTAVWLYDNSETLLTQTFLEQQVETPLSEAAATPTTKPYNAPAASGGTVLGSKVYDITETIHIENTRDLDLTQLTLWVALIHDIKPFQEVLKMEVNTTYTEIIMDEHANKFAVFEMGDVHPGEILEVTFNYRVRINEIEFDTGDCQGSLPNVYINAEEKMESDAPEIIQLAKQLSASKENVCEVSKNIYTYVGQTIDYQVTNEDKGALWMLKNKKGDCTGFTETQIALSRALDIPARFIEGFVYLGDGEYLSNEIKHNWAEVYLPNNGWVPMDPTWGSLPGQEEMFFARAFSDRFILTYSRYLDALGGHHEYMMDYTWLGEENPVALNRYIKWGFKLVSQ